MGAMKEGGVWFRTSGCFKRSQKSAFKWCLFIFGQLLKSHTYTVDPNEDNRTKSCWQAPVFNLFQLQSTLLVSGYLRHSYTFVPLLLQSFWLLGPSLFVQSVSARSLRLKCCLTSLVFPDHWGKIGLYDPLHHFSTIIYVQSNRRLPWKYIQRLNFCMQSR